MAVTVYKETVCIACISLLWRRVDVSGQRKKALCVPWPVTALVRFGLNSNEQTMPRLGKHQGHQCSGIKEKIRVRAQLVPNCSK